MGLDVSVSKGVGFGIMHGFHGLADQIEELQPLVLLEMVLGPTPNLELVVQGSFLEDEIGFITAVMRPVLGRTGK